MANGLSFQMPYTFTLATQVPAGVVTACGTIATAVNTAATVAGQDGTFASQKLAELEAFLNKLYGGV